jgi:hypothetical protein
LKTKRNSFEGIEGDVGSTLSDPSVASTEEVTFTSDATDRLGTKDIDKISSNDGSKGLIDRIVQFINEFTSKYGYWFSVVAIMTYIYLEQQRAL